MPEFIELPIGTNKEKLREMLGFLCTTFDNTVRARTNQVDGKYKRWHDNYSAKPAQATRSTPFRNASNFVPQLIRMHVDILSARILGIILGTKPFWTPRTLIPTPHQWMEELTRWMEFTSFTEMELNECLDGTIFRTIKNGTIVMKAPWVQDSHWSVAAGVGATGVPEEKEITTEGMDAKPIPFDDFFPYPITASTLKDVDIKFHRIRLSKEEVEFRKAAGLWKEDAAKLLLEAPSQRGEPKREGEAQEAGLLTRDVDRPFNAVEAWLSYPIGNDASRRYKIVVTFNPQQPNENGYLKGIYNYYTSGIDPFVDFRFAPREDLFYGYSLPEILEQSQEEQAQIHNSRRDASLITNTPGWKRRRYADMPDPTHEWYPGKVFLLDDMQDLEPLQFAAQYNPMIDEENFLLSLAERYTGIGPPMQGYGAGALEGSRGIYSSQGSMAMLAEGNKRIDIYIKRLRMPFHHLGKLIFQSNRDFKPEGVEYTMWGAAGQAIQQTFQFKEPAAYKGVLFEIGASDASANKEIDRSNLLLMANTMASYYRQITEAASVITQVPETHPLRSIILSTLEGARDLANRLLFQFDIGDRDRLLPDITKILSGQQQAPGAGRAGLPPAQGAVPPGGLQALSSRLTALQGGNSPAFAQGGQSGGTFPAAG